jgi:hypothetical protein
MVILILDFFYFCFDRNLSNVNALNFFGSFPRLFAARTVSICNAIPARGHPNMNTCGNITPLLSRRSILQNAGLGFGWLAFSSLFGRAASTAPATGPLSPKATHFPARAKRVIFLCMRGGPSHVDTFDYKAKLQADSGKEGKRPGTKLMGSKWEFKQHGKSGLWISSLFPETAKLADEMCLVRSMQTNLPAHPQAFMNLHTGTSQFIRPSLGSWALYGLGSQNENLPGFLTITPPANFGGAQNYGSAFLPAIYQGTRIGADNRPISGAAVRNLTPPTNPAAQRAELDFIQDLNRQKLKRDGGQNTEVEGVIESYELAFRMQREMPQLLDLEKESAATKSLYGLDQPHCQEFGTQLLAARRMVERGVRFIQIQHGGGGAGAWDAHSGLKGNHEKLARAVDQPTGALLIDLERRGLLDETLVIFATEFGRTPGTQGADGRDHHIFGFSVWMAGGGLKRGVVHGATDEIGFHATEHRHYVTDIHATLLHQLGLDSRRLEIPGRKRLDIDHGQPIREIIA